ncbi:MAG: PDZ domain-containing protein, partial [Pseudomonadales bacterium]
QVKPGVGAQAGLQVGDIITMLDGEKVQNLSQLNDAIAAAPKDKAIPMRIVRRGSPIFIPIKLQK